MARDQLLGAGRQDLGLDLARRDGVDPDAHRPEVVRHLAGQRRQRRLGGGVGRPGERMHPGAGDRGDVDDRALRRGQLVDQPARQHHAGEEVDVEHLAPGRAGRWSACRAAPPSAPFGEMPALLTSASSRPAGSRRRISATASMVSLGSARSTWMWSSGPASQGQSSGKRVPRAGDHPPAGRGEALDGRVADAAAGAGQEQRLAVGHRRYARSDPGEQLGLLGLELLRGQDLLGAQLGQPLDLGEDVRRPRSRQAPPLAARLRPRAGRRPRTSAVLAGEGQRPVAATAAARSRRCGGRRCRRPSPARRRAIASRRAAGKKA